MAHQSMKLVFRAAPLVLVAVLTLAATHVVRAQGPSNLAKENEELRKQVEDLKEQLDRARQRISALNDEIARLREQIAESHGGPKQGADGGAPEDTDWKTSPDAMFNYLVESYAQSLGGVPMDSRAEKTRYRRDVGEWVRKMQQELRDSVEWTVRITDSSGARHPQPTVRFVVVNPDNGEAISGESEMRLSSRFARTVLADSSQDLWKVTGQVQAMPVVNARREEKGSSDDPRFIGPYAEFGFDLSVQSIEPAAPSN